MVCHIHCQVVTSNFIKYLYVLTNLLSGHILLINWKFKSHKCQLFSAEHEMRTTHSKSNIVKMVCGPLHSTLWLLICLPSFSWLLSSACENEILLALDSLMNLHFQTRSQKSVILPSTYPKIESNRMSQLHSYHNHWPTYYYTWSE